MSKVFSARLISQQSLNVNYRIASFLPLIEQAHAPLPGQFYMVQVSSGTDPLLKRPFSIFSNKGGLLHFLYRIVGKGTRLLSMLNNGKELQLIGPLGNPYQNPKDDFIAIAGGSGFASIHCLLEKYKKRGILFYGARDKSEIVSLDNLNEITKEFIFTTDDGSLGLKGTTIDALKGYNGFKGLPVYACGPKQMLKAISIWAKENYQTCYLSLEEHMACGIGACLSCVVKTNGGLKSVCKDGAIFDSRELIWD